MDSFYRALLPRKKLDASGRECNIDIHVAQKFQTFKKRDAYIESFERGFINKMSVLLP